MIPTELKRYIAASEMRRPRTFSATRPQDMAAVEGQEREQVDHRQHERDEAEEHERVAGARRTFSWASAVMPTMLETSWRVLELVSALPMPVIVLVVTCHISLNDAPAADSTPNCFGRPEAEADQHAPGFRRSGVRHSVSRCRPGSRSAAPAAGRQPSVSGPAQVWEAIARTRGEVAGGGRRSPRCDRRGAAPSAAGSPFSMASTEVGRRSCAPRDRGSSARRR